MLTSLEDGSKGQPHNTRPSFTSFLLLTSKQFESSANGFTTMSSNRNERWSESYLVFS